MKTIHKFNVGTGCKIRTFGSFFKPLSAQIQGGSIYLWAMVETPEITGGKSEDELFYTVRQIVIYGTGYPIALENLEYVSTVQESPYVWHVFVRQA